MKFIISRNILLQELNILNKIVPSVSANPVLMMIYFNVKEDSIILKASDGNISCSMNLKATDDKNKTIIKDIEEGEFLVSAKYLFDMLSKLEDEFVNFNMVDSNFLSIYDSSTDFNIVTREAAEFPELDFNVDSDSQSFHIKSSELKLLFDKTSFAVATKSTKDMFYGINISAKDGKLYFLATDSFRMARYAIPNKSEKAEFKFTCPIKALNVVSNLVKNQEVEIIFDEKQALFKTDDLILSTRLYIGDFPSPERLIPSSFDYSITFDSDSFLKSVGRVVILASLDGKQPTCKLTISRETGVTLSSYSEGNGDSKDNLSNCEYKLPDNENVFEIGINTDYVQQAIKALDSKKATLVFTSPIRMFMAKNDDPDNIQILTPIRITSSK